MNLDPVPEIPALVAMGKEDWVVVADLHVGIEVQLRIAGFNIPSQMQKIMLKLKELRKSAKNLMILGDLKHKIPSVGRREDLEIRQLISAMFTEYERVLVVAGNHDGGLSSALPEGTESVSGRGIILDNVGFFHGHIWPSEDVMNADRIVMAHAHPSVLLVDSMGGRHTEKCWLRSGLVDEKVLERYDACPDELIVVPAFNPLLTGTPVNSSRGTMLGPIFRNNITDPATYKAYLLDGTNIGNPLKLNGPRER